MMEPLDRTVGLRCERRTIARVFVACASALAWMSAIAVGAAIVASGSTASARAPQPPDPCRLVDRRDASRALRMPIVEAKLETMGPSRTCTLRTTQLLRSVIVTAWRWESPGEARARFAALVAEASKRMRPTEQIGGLGDEAASIASNVYVRKGAVAFAFNVIDGTVGAPRTARTVELAKRTLARLR